ncbi:MAG: aldo/keto reductase [Clostridiales bacterium]|jgi:alcohol dehydrogenase (NADP+)|nr:aldo/keto reductase [Clostridiales bacterium]
MNNEKVKYQPDPFFLSTDGIDPSRVPKRKLNNGFTMPAIGLGTFGSDHVSADEVAAAVKGAISVGYRMIDCASVYGNEKQIGQALKEVLDSGLVKREELFITSKIWNDMHGSGDILVSCANSLRDLGLDYLDLYFVHWPFPNYHEPGCDGNARNLCSRPFFIDEFMKVWQQMERLVDISLVKSIGTSSVTIPKMEQIWQLVRIKPAVNEMELHPHFQQPELFEYMRKLGVQPIGFSPIGSPARPDRDKTETDTVDIEDPVIVTLAKKYGVHPAVICVKWAVQRGQTPIPFSIHRKNYLSNLACTVSEPLTADEMEAINKIDKNCRLIKGQVFLWPGAKSWENLWDNDGVIDRTGWTE